MQRELFITCEKCHCLKRTAASLHTFNFYLVNYCIEVLQFLNLRLMPKLDIFRQASTFHLAHLLRVLSLHLIPYSLRRNSIALVLNFVCQFQELWLDLLNVLDFSLFFSELLNGFEKWLYAILRVDKFECLQSEGTAGILPSHVTNIPKNSVAHLSHISHLLNSCQSF